MYKPNTSELIVSAQSFVEQMLSVPPLPNKTCRNAPWEEQEPARVTHTTFRTIISVGREERSLVASVLNKREGKCGKN